MVKRLKARVRGIVGLGILGAVAGFGVGAIWGVASAMIRSGVYVDPDYLRFLTGTALGNAIGFMKIGTFTTAGFGVLLAAVDSRRSLDELPLWRMALFGALVGASFPPIYVIGQMGFSVYLDAALSFLPVMGVLGVVGGAVASSMVAIAKRASRPELESSGESSGVLPESDGSRVEWSGAHRGIDRR